MEAAHLPGPDPPGLDHPRMGQDESRLGIARPERAEAGQGLGQGRGRRAARKRAVELQGRAERAEGLAVDMVAQEAAEVVQQVMAYGEPSGHAMAAAVHQQPRLPRLYHGHAQVDPRSEEHTSELQSLMRISYAVFCLKKNNR